RNHDQGPPRSVRRHPRRAGGRGHDGLRLGRSSAAPPRPGRTLISGADIGRLRKSVLSPADRQAVTLLCWRDAVWSHAMDTVELDHLIKWLPSGEPPPPQVLTPTCERLPAAGVPLWRVGIFVRTLHPDAYGRSFIWRPGADVVINTAGFDLPDSPEYKRSPLAVLYASGHEVRYRLDDPESRRFPFFDDMREEGVTDYIALPLHFTDGTTHAASWTTKAPGGFTDAQLASLRTVIQPFARLAEIFAMRRTAAALLDTYVGNRAGERIWAGQIR